MNKDKADYDGLSTDEAVAQMLAHPEQGLIIVARLDVVAIEHNVLTGVRTPKVAHRHVEILSGGLAEQGIGLLEKRFSERTGRAAPPATLWDATGGEGGDPAADAPPEVAEPGAAKPKRTRAKPETDQG
jgi:hypothetical protein